MIFFLQNSAPENLNILRKKYQEYGKNLPFSSFSPPDNQKSHPGAYFFN
jgi:hypothetical protein